MKVTFSPQAIRQLNATYAYIARESPGAASRVTARVNASASLLGEQPDLGRKTEAPPVRVLPLPDYPYLIFYALRGDREVRILRIRHAARQRRRP